MPSRIQTLDNYTAGEHINFILNLRRKKRRQERRVRIAEARAARIQEILEALNAKKDYLDQYKSKIDQTNTLGKDIINTLERNNTILQRAAVNVGLTNDSVQILAVNAETASKETEDLVAVMSKLLYDISCLPQVPNPDGPIMKALDELASSIRVAMNSALDVIGLTLETYQSTEILKEQIGNKNGASGLTMSYKKLDKIINIKHDPDSKIKFPREGCPDDLWDQLKKEYERVVAYIAALEERLNRIMERKNLALARMEAISTSLNAAEAAASC